MMITSQQITIITYTPFHAIHNTLCAINDIIYLRHSAAPIYTNNSLVGSTSTIHSRTLDPIGSGFLIITNAAADNSHDNLEVLIKSSILDVSAARLFLEHVDRVFANDPARLGLVAEYAGTEVSASVEALFSLAGLVPEGDDDDDDDTRNWSDSQGADFFDCELPSDVESSEDTGASLEAIRPYLHGLCSKDVGTSNEVVGFDNFDLSLIPDGVDLIVWHIDIWADEMDGVGGSVVEEEKEEEEPKMNWLESSEKHNETQMETVEQVPPAGD